MLNVNWAAPLPKDPSCPCTGSEEVRQTTDGAPRFPSPMGQFVALKKNFQDVSEACRGLCGRLRRMYSKIECGPSRKWDNMSRPGNIYMFLGGGNLEFVNYRKFRLGLQQKVMAHPR